ncbi:transposase [Dactylosporangium sp. CA-233914]|uniref:transposase n=1 Tax=Dactylosporangium sp. CA-233914 TaxID=3239934 RepID=UPI003D92727F
MITRRSRASCRAVNALCSTARRPRFRAFSPRFPFTPETVHRASTAHGTTVVGPVRQDSRAVERPGFAKEEFHVDWQAETVMCPQGTVGLRWKPTVADGKPRLSVLFRRADCRACTVRQQCTGNVDGKGRHLLLLPEPLQEIQTRARALQQTPERKQRYALRAGCEAAVSETVHAYGLRQCRYRGLASRQHRSAGTIRRPSDPQDAIIRRHGPRRPA